MTDRYDYIDLLKGFGILLVVWAHTNSFLFKEIYAFHMPLFSFLAGIFAFKKETFKVVFVKKFRTLLIPFFVFSFLWLGISLIILKYDGVDISFAFKQVIYILAGSGQNSISELSNVTVWFLPYLFTTFIAHHFISVSKYKIILFFIIVISGLAMGYSGIPLPYSIDTAMTLYPFFYAGSVFFTDKNSRILMRSIKYIPIFFIVYMVSCAYNSTVDTASNNIGNPILFYISAFSAIYFFMFISMTIKKIKILNFIGSNSIDVLIFHMIFVKLFRYYSIFNNNLYDFIISVVLSLFFGFIVREYIPQLYGKNIGKTNDSKCA